MFVYVFVGGSLRFAIYTMVAEAGTARRIGKHARPARGQRVRRADQPRAGDRAAAAGALQVFWIDALFALFTDKSQRAFELLSKTRVVRSTRDRA